MVLAKKELELYEYRVLVAQGGAEGFLLAYREKPDLILLDIQMPDKDGFTVLNELKSNDATSHIPVIMLTVAGETSSIMRSQSEGAVDYFIKPIECAELLKYIKRYTKLTGESVVS